MVNSRHRDVQGRNSPPRGGLEARSPLAVASSGFDRMAGQPLPEQPRPVPEVRAGSWGQLREHLLDRSAPIGTVDAVWQWLIEQAREPGPGPRHGAPVRLGCLGLAVPMLAATTGRFVAPHSTHRDDAESELVAGFLRQLHQIDPDQPHLWPRLRSAMGNLARSWAHKQSGAATATELDDQPDTSLRAMRTPAGHPELVLAQAVAHEVITAQAAELIASTRWESRSVTSLAQQLPAGRSQWTVRKLRQRAEADLTAWLHQQAVDPVPATLRPGRRAGASGPIRSRHSFLPRIATAPAPRHQEVR
jgi:hypothetical protein